MTVPMMWRGLAATLVFMGVARTGGAQGAAITPAMDRAIARARAAVDAGDGADARGVLDSLVKVAPGGSNDLAEALFWRATLAERMSDAERDWKRLIIEIPLAPRASDALLRMGELEMLRGHPADARTYFARVVREFPAAPTRARGQLWVAKSYAAQRDMPRACVALADASATGVPEGELRLQAEEMGRQCAAVDKKLIAKATNDTVAPKAEQKTEQKTEPKAAPKAESKAEPKADPKAEQKADAKPSASSAPKGARFSVQLAAFDTRDEAERLVKRLVARDIDARVDGDEKPFRVRVGYFGTRAGANEALAKLKKGGNAGFIAEIAK